MIFLALGEELFWYNYSPYTGTVPVIMADVVSVPQVKVSRTVSCLITGTGIAHSVSNKGRAF